MRSKKVLLFVLLLTLCVFLVAFTGCADNSSVSPEDDEDLELFSSGFEGWDVFEDFNPIETSYWELSDLYNFREEGTSDGGVLLQVDDQDLYFGFPANTMAEINDNDCCTAVYGTLNTIFGIDVDCHVDDLEKLLNVTFKEDIDESLIGSALTSSGSYYVQLYTSSRDDELAPETGVAIFNNNDENREGADEVPSEQVWVDLHKVDSSAIHSMGYDREQEILAIEFKESQELWYYYGVPESVYEEMENADSIGSYYNQNIKGVYASAEQH